MSVLPDVPAVDRPFDYVVDESTGGLNGHVPLRPGTVVKVPFSGRSVRGWVLQTDVNPRPGLDVLAVSKVVGYGPDETVMDLCRFVAWRWAGRFTSILRLATPNRVVRSLGVTRVRKPSRPIYEVGRLHEMVVALLEMGPGTSVVEVSPTDDLLAIAAAAAAMGQVLFVVPGVAEADRVARSLRSVGASVARWPDDWSAAATGASLVGGRGAVFATMPSLSAIVVFDEHDEMLQSERSPTWNARDVAVERARRAGIPCLLVSPCPSLEALVAQGSDDRQDTSMAAGLPEPRASVGRSALRRGWAALTVIDRRGEDVGRSGLFSSQLVGMMRDRLDSGGSVACVLNRTGRARMLVCRSCSSVAACGRCGAASFQDDELRLVCPRCGDKRPTICDECGSTSISLLRLGIGRAREELQALLGVEVALVSGAGEGGPSGGVELARAVIGTKAVLSRRNRSSLVAFLDFDQEILAPRYRAAEEALVMLMWASRQVGGRHVGGHVVVQTRRPDHETILAALNANPSAVSVREFDRRQLLGFPPLATVAVVGGAAGGEFIERFGEPGGVQLGASGDGEWLLRSRVPGLLQESLASVSRPSGRLRLWVDPYRLGG